MRTIRNEDFMKWLEGVSIHNAGRGAGENYLQYRPARDYSRFWELPGDPGAWPHFTASSLRALDPWETGYLCPRAGRWPVAGESQQDEDHVRDVVLRGVGIPDGWTGAVQFDRQEEHVIATIMFVFFAFGWCSLDDLFFIPDHGRQFIQTDHHYVIHVDCANEEDVPVVVGRMSTAGYELPTELPDETFKRPSWMPEKNT